MKAGRVGEGEGSSAKIVNTVREKGEGKGGVDRGRESSGPRFPRRSRRRSNLTKVRKVSTITGFPCK